MASERAQSPGEITVCLVNDQEISRLNAKYLKKNRPTDVIAFSLGDKKSLCADIVVSTDTASRQAKIFNTSPSYELYLYIVHGVLHVLGYDDKTTKQSQLMQKKSIRILSALRIAQSAKRTTHNAGRIAHNAQRKNVYP